MDFLAVFIVAVFACWIGWHLRGITLLARFGSDPDHFIDILKKIKECNEEEERESVQSKNGTELAIERHGDVLYAFIKDTNQFVAQGPNLDSLLEQAQKRFPGRKFFGLIPNGDPAKELV